MATQHRSFRTQDALLGNLCLARSRRASRRDRTGSAGRISSPRSLQIRSTIALALASRTKRMIAKNQAAHLTPHAEVQRR